MPNFPSIYLQLEDIERRIRGIEERGTLLVGSAGGILQGSYPDPTGLQGDPINLNGSLKATSTITADKQLTVGLRGADTSSLVVIGSPEYPALGTPGGVGPESYLHVRGPAGSPWLGGWISLSRDDIPDTKWSLGLNPGYGWTNNPPIDPLFSGALHIAYNGGPIASFRPNGYTGITHITPEYPLDVGGLANFRSGIRIPSGQGISFIQGTSAPLLETNTLNDYESGRWTPIFAYHDGTTRYPLGGITYLYNSGYYVKIGQFVHLSGKIHVNDAPSPIGGLNQPPVDARVFIDQLPFRVKTNSSYPYFGYSGNIGYYGYLTTETPRLEAPTDETDGPLNGYQVYIISGKAEPTVTYFRVDQIVSTATVIHFSISYITEE